MTEARQISRSPRILFFGCVFLFLGLTITLLAQTDEIRPWHFFLGFVLLGLSIYFSRFISVYASDEKQIFLVDLMDDQIVFEKILRIKKLPIYSTNSRIYSITYLSLDGASRTRLIRIPYWHWEIFEEIRKKNVDGKE